MKIHKEQKEQLQKDILIIDDILRRKWVVALQDTSGLRSSSQKSARGKA